QELEALAEEKRRKEAEARHKEHEAQRRKAMVFEQHSILQRKLAEDARKKQAEEEEEKRKRAAEEKEQQKTQKTQPKDPKDSKDPKDQKKTEEDEAARKARAEKLDAKIWKQRIPDPSEPITTACFEVYKMGKHQRTHLFSGDKSSWIIGRGPAGVDVVISNARISRKHAEVTSQGPLMFLNDMGSTYGSAMNGEKIEAKSPVELTNGARFRFGGLPELYVYREPAEEEEEPSSPPVEAEVSGMAMAEDFADLPPPQSEPLPPPTPAPAPEIDAEAAAAACAAQQAQAAEEDEARVRRIQQKRQERRAAEAAEKVQMAAKKEEERKKKEEERKKKQDGS
ncbi:unnamed protein product, partial [Effrenium voratum]